MDFDTIRNNPKLTEEYTPEEREIILANQDQWDEEENRAFKEWVAPAEDATDDVVEDDDSGDGDPAPTETPTEEGSPPIIPTPETQPPPQVTFSTKEELDSYIDDKIKQMETQKGESLTKEEKKEVTDYFEEGWLPQNPNDLVKAMLDNPQVLERLREKLSPEVVKDLQQYSEREKEELRKTNELFDSQYNKLASEGKVPALNTPEGQEVNKQIAILSAKHGKENYLDGYELWSQVPKEFGGGYEVKPAQSEAKAKLSAQKKAASMVGSGAGAEGTKKNGPLPYNVIANARSLDDLLENDVE